MTAWRDTEVWQAVAVELRQHRQRGLAAVMTEDTVRFATARALTDAGVGPAGLRVEWPHPVLQGSRIDLVTGGDPPAALVEFKFPREPSEKNAPWTMVFGEVLKDFYRLASCPGDPGRLFVFVESSRLRTYLAGAAERYGLRLDADRVELRPTAAAQLPTTAAQIVGADLAARQVTAQRLHTLDIDDTLRLSVYLVDGLDAAPGPAPAAVVSESPIPEPPMLSTATATATGARAGAAAESASAAGVAGGVRHQILDAIRAILARSPDDTFTPLQVVDEMKRRGGRYAESTVRTMVTAHMCTNAPDNSAATYDDLERVSQGVYRLVGTSGSSAD